MDKKLDMIMTYVKKQRRELIAQNEEQAQHQDNQKNEAQLTHNLLIDLKDEIQFLNS